MVVVGERISEEMATLTKEKRAEIYISDRERRAKTSSAIMEKLIDEGKILPVGEVAKVLGNHYELGDGYTKGNLYRLAHMGDIQSMRMCYRCGGLDITVRQIGYWKTWDSAQAVCMDCGWDAGGADIYISEPQIVSDYHVWCNAMKEKPEEHI